MKEIKTKVFKKSEYLYGVNATQFMYLNYEDAIRYKITLCDNLISKLYEVDFLSRDMNRIGAVIKARSFNESLVKEMEES